MSATRGGHASGGGGGHGGGGSRANTLDLSKHVDHPVIVKLSGGRQVRGILKGWDPLVNLVLDETIEELRGTFMRPVGRAVYGGGGRWYSRLGLLGCCSGPSLVFGHFSCHRGVHGVEVRAWRRGSVTGTLSWHRVPSGALAGEGVRLRGAVRRGCERRPGSGCCGRGRLSSRF
ncbi:hypothetical protein I4F81_006812 [Pyropia yezoensis]|uniref:Uncharacterized protein n=1 Tax=Pyropia yezoensis TaxID=2788 RepID=A0ACC3C2D6_PYRYE|nr:hypothetical protein I4F81_006812 [Neopyropia yezoensis]